MPHHTDIFKQNNDFLKICVDSLNQPGKLPKMKVLIEIDDELGEMLDALAKEQDRSRSAQARHMLQKAIRESVEPAPEEAAA